MTKNFLVSGVLKKGNFCRERTQRTQKKDTNLGFSASLRSLRPIAANFALVASWRRFPSRNPHPLQMSKNMPPLTVGMIAHAVLGANDLRVNRTATGASGWVIVAVNFKFGAKT